MYTVKFVDDRTFDELPYNKVSTSIGVADRNSGIAYVRDTGDPMAIFTAYHELEHLKGDDLGEHESPGEDGIYYKKMNEVLGPVANVASAIPGPWQIPAMAYSGYNAIKGSGKGQQQPQQQPQEGMMSQFGPAISTPQAPATSQVGGQTSLGMAGGQSGGRGLTDKIRELLSQRQKGFYSGRNAGGSL